MPRKLPEVGPNQGAMFVQGETSGAIYPAQSARPNSVSVEAKSSDGPSVDLLERNALLQNVLGRFGIMSRTVGLQIASQTGARAGLEAQYEDVDRVVGGAVNSSQRKLSESKSKFAQAFGLQQMLESGMMSEVDAKTMVRDSFTEEFIPLFADPKGAKNRKVMKRWINFQERTLTGKTTRKPTVDRPRVVNEVKRDHRVALVHVLTPKFQGIEASDFDDIPLEVVTKASPDELRRFLLEAKDDGRSVVRYQSPESDNRWVSMSVTPKEFGLFSRHIDMLANSAYNGILVTRDKKLQKDSGDPAALARTDVDIATANRGAVRQVMKKQQDMESYLETDIMPRIDVIAKFLEMTINSNLTRGSEETVRERFETLRLYVFGDMLDAIGNQKQWTAQQSERAVRILQKRIYLEPNPRSRVENFEGMLDLAAEYYGRKRALVMGRIAESKQYYREHPEAVADVEATDLSRAAQDENLENDIE